MNSLLLSYLRYFPIEYGKHYLRRFVKFPQGTVIYTTRHKVRFKLYLDQLQMKEVYCFDVHEKNTTLQLARLIKPDYTFIDVGANAGFYAVTFAKLLPQGKVHCFEPNPIAAAQLRENVSLNEADNVVVNEAGLSDRESTAELIFGSTFTGSVYNTAGSGARTEKIKLLRFDDYYFANNLGRLDVIKADIEGGELSFLKGAEKAIANNPRLIISLEMMDENFRKAGYDAEYLFNYMKGLGFTAYLPKPWPFGLTRTNKMPANHYDNIIFLRGY